MQKVDKLSTENAGVFAALTAQSLYKEKLESLALEKLSTKQKNDGGQPLFIHNSVDKGRMRIYSMIVYFDFSTKKAPLCFFTTRRKKRVHFRLVDNSLADKKRLNKRR